MCLAVLTTSFVRLLSIVGDGANGVDTGSSNPAYEHESIPAPNGNINNNNNTALVSKGQEVDEVKIEVKDEGDFLDRPKRERIGKESAKWLVAKDSVVVTVICGPLQGLSACFAAFTHGGNDVRLVARAYLSSGVCFVHPCS